jgi:hypothetical protein
LASDGGLNSPLAVSFGGEDGAVSLPVG